MVVIDFSAQQLSGRASDLQEKEMKRAVEGVVQAHPSHAFQVDDLFAARNHASNVIAGMIPETELGLALVAVIDLKCVLADQFRSGQGHGEQEVSKLAHEQRKAIG